MKNLFAIFLCSSLMLPLWSQTKVYVFEIKETIAAPAVQTTKNALKKADSIHADLVLLKLDTYGGEVAAADEIRTLLLEANIPVWAFIENNAASAGAFIAIACDSIFMKPGATIGAATVVNQEGQKVGEKYQTFMRSRMRATAEQNGRNPDIAEAMVEAIRTIPGVVDSGRVVSLTSSEAIRLDFCDGEYSSVEALLKGEGIESFQLVQHRETWVSTLMRFFLNPMVNGLLIVIIIGALYFEFKTPGIGLPTLVAAIAAVLYFAPLYLEGFAAYWEIIAFVVGWILILLEIFVIPGFGVAGILGGTLVLMSLILGLVGVAENNPYIIPLPDTDGLMRASLTVILSVIVSSTLMILFGKRFMHSSMFRRVSVATVQDKSKGYIAHPEVSDAIIGQTGIAVSQLRPTGNVKIQGQTYEAISETGMIEKGQPITVIGKRDFILVVRESVTS